jgi:hypothetical protein
MRWAILVLVLFSASFLSSPAKAILIDRGNTTIDADTGLEWLDLGLGPLSAARGEGVACASMLSAPGAVGV